MADDRRTPWFVPGRTERLAGIVLLLMAFMFLIAKLIPTTDPPTHWNGHNDDLIILHVFEIGSIIIMVLTFIHAWRHWGRTKTFFFFVFALTYGFILEEVTVTLSGYYEYNPNSWIIWGSTQMAVPFCWTAVIYGCIRLIESRKELAGLAKIEKGLLAGVMAVSLDVGIDAVFANYGFWHWEEWQWLGVPLANYTAWFMAVGGFTIVWTDINEIDIPDIHKEISLGAGVIISYGMLLLMVYATYLLQVVIF